MEIFRGFGLLGESSFNEKVFGKVKVSMADDSSVDFHSGPLGLKLSGPNAILILIFITELAIAGLSFWENIGRAKEHLDISCMLRLNLFVNQQSRNEPLDWSKLPVDLYGCVPRFLYERGRPQ